MLQHNWISLIKHEFQSELQFFKSNKKSKDKSAFRWAVFYAVLGIGTAFGLLTFFVIQDLFQLHYLWYTLAWVPFWVLGISHQIIGKEWKQRTFGWWLMLPYSRTQLVLSKFVACLILTLVILAGKYLIIGLLSLYVAILQNDVQALGHFWLWGLIFSLFILVWVPGVLLFGMLSSLISHSRFIPILPIVWIVFWILCGLAAWLVSTSTSEMSLFAAMSDLSQPPSLPMSTALMIFIILSGCIGFMLLKWMARILQHNLKL